MKDLLVIFYFNGKAIIQDELDRIFYLECEPNEAPVGTVVEETGVLPITRLDQAEQEAILKLL